MTKKQAKPGHSKRLDPAAYGVDLPAILEQIKPHLEGMTQAQIGAAADLNPVVVSHYMTGYREPSIGALAAIAVASGGQLEVTFKPPKSGNYPRCKNAERFS